MIPRLGEQVKPGMRYTHRPGAYVILRQGRDVLLTHQARPRPEFQLPGGGIDAGEHPIPALHREVLEETGWSMAAPRRLGAYRRFVYMPEYKIWAEKICHVFEARPVLQRHAPLEDAHDAVWAPLADAARILASPGDRRFAARLLRHLDQRG